MARKLQNDLNIIELEYVLGTSVDRKLRAEYGVISNNWIFSKNNDYMLHSVHFKTTPIQLVESQLALGKPPHGDRSPNSLPLGSFHPLLFLILLNVEKHHYGTLLPSLYTQGHPFLPQKQFNMEANVSLRLVLNHATINLNVLLGRKPQHTTMKTSRTVISIIRSKSGRGRPILLGTKRQKTLHIGLSRDEVKMNKVVQSLYNELSRLRSHVVNYFDTIVMTKGPNNQTQHDQRAIAGLYKIMLEYMNTFGFHYTPQSKVEVSLRLEILNLNIYDRSASQSYYGLQLNGDGNCPCSVSEILNLEGLSTTYARFASAHSFLCPLVANA
ncbi:uncharacterized protein BDR25DRAFT_359959 [Lindgomyces ingoldianus]|uniref:Uncharacterized protein n=1 Tax=Lindgomyces ingoldianus TaxID=673940 RepID=A0ACB6QGY1_9PLEO|nr:uncharacterized protein BDR25DRAFT_359959 [Lindgomyces ingoldianus]KAF2466179.1 hypothetical protein BDR25DRAFT_359959 [Lindgomyces ingoldianus]